MEHGMMKVHKLPYSMSISMFDNKKAFLYLQEGFFICIIEYGVEYQMMKFVHLHHSLFRVPCSIFVSL